MERRHDVLRLQPHMIPALKEVLNTGVDQVKEALVGLSRGGRELMTAPVVSATMLVHNRADLVVAAARSVLGQTCTELELVIVDDGSTDETPAAVAQTPSPGAESGSSAVELTMNAAASAGRAAYCEARSSAPDSRNAIAVDFMK